jgi:hypothetical protein
MNIKQVHKAVAIVLLAGVMGGCATTTPPPQIAGIASAPASHFHFGYNVEGLNHGLTNVQTFDNSSSTFFILPPGVSADRAYTKGQISKKFRKDGVYSIVDAVADTWLFTASNGEAYCVTKAGDPSKVCSKLINSSHDAESQSQNPVATPLPSRSLVESSPAKNKPRANRPHVVAEDKVIERESIAQIRARLENLQKQLQSIIEQLKKEDKNA